jgi:hypothetical protein
MTSTGCNRFGDYQFLHITKIEIYFKHFVCKGFSTSVRNRNFPCKHDVDIFIGQNTRPCQEIGIFQLTYLIPFLFNDIVCWHRRLFIATSKEEYLIIVAHNNRILCNCRFPTYFVSCKKLFIKLESDLCRFFGSLRRLYLPHSHMFFLIFDTT